MEESNSYCAFLGDRLIRSGPLPEVLAAAKLMEGEHELQGLLFFNNENGKQVDFDIRGSLQAMLDRARPQKAVSGRGRPKLGVESHEVTLLPRHWKWLEQQPNGISAALRKLVEKEMRTGSADAQSRARRDAVYNIMSALAGNRPNFEEAARALYSSDLDRFASLTESWPADIRKHLNSMLTDASGASGVEIHS